MLAYPFLENYRQEKTVKSSLNKFHRFSWIATILACSAYSNTAHPSV